MAVTLVVVAVSAGVLMYFASARIEIVPKAARADVQGNFTAGQSEGQLSYKVITAQKIATQSVKGTGTKTVTEKAQGSITIYNTQSKSQTLIANTRFVTDAKLIYRIKSAVIVPAGSAAKPGSVTATVIADQPGSAYNIAPTALTVAAFQNTPQAKQVYARSTAAMTGGASGTVPSADAVAEVEARRQLMTALEGDLQKSLSEQLSGSYAGYILLSGAATTTYAQAPSEQSQTAGMVDIKEQGTLTAIVFQNASLAKAVGTTISDLARGSEAMTLTSVEGLTFSLSGAFPQSENATFSFTLSGPAALKYSVDSSRIAAAIAGKTRSEASVALTNFPEVDEAKILLRPFWRSHFPEDPASITIVVLEPKR